MDVSVTIIQLQDKSNIHVDRHVRGFSIRGWPRSEKKYLEN